MIEAHAHPTVYTQQSSSSSSTEAAKTYSSVACENHACDDYAVVFTCTQISLCVGVGALSKVRVAAVRSTASQYLLAAITDDC
jgi:hypothetical protein